MTEIDELAGWVREFVSAAEACADPFRGLRRLGAFPPSNGREAVVRALAAAWCATCNRSTIAETIRSTANRLDPERHLREVDATLGERLRQLEGMLVRLLPHERTNNGLVSGSWFASGGFITHPAAAHPLFCAPASEAPAWLQQVIPPESRLDEMKLVCGPAGRQFWPVAETVEWTTSLRAHQLRSFREAEERRQQFEREDAALAARQSLSLVDPALIRKLEERIAQLEAAK